MGATGGFQIQGFPYRSQSDAYHDVVSLSLDTEMGGMYLAVAWGILWKKHGSPGGGEEEVVRGLGQRLIRTDDGGGQMRTQHDLESYSNVHRVVACSCDRSRDVRGKMSAICHTC